MHAFWVGLGIVVLVLGLLDIFLTALNYDEAGFLAIRLCALQWRLLRGVTRRLSRRWRPIALRQVTGLQLMLSVVTWLGCVVVGFGLIYYGLMAGSNFSFNAPNLGPGLFSAMYLSAAQLATVGTSQLSPETDLLRVLTIAETLSSLVLVSLILTFLLGVYQVVRDLRTLSSNFTGVGAGVGDPLVGLGRYFPEGQPSGLDGHLEAISDSLWSYSDGLHLHHVAYYFQSGRDQFALPYVLDMLGGSLAALRWGLPAGHPASLEPLLTRLVDQFTHFADYLQEQRGWTSRDVPEVVAFADFCAAGHTRQTPDAWVARFLRLNLEMARLTRLDGPGDLREAYQRYRGWLPFAYRAAQVTAAVSRDLDYQPVFDTSTRAARPGAGIRAGAPLAVEPAPPSWRGFLQRWVAVPDPGLVRLNTAAAATLAAVVPAALLYLLYRITDVQPLPPAMFGGMTGMLSAAMPRDVSVTDRRLTTGLAVLPAIAFASLGAAVSTSFPLSTAVLVLVVLLGVGVGGLGPRATALGQIAFMTFYFGIVLRPPPALLPSFALAAVVGVLCALLFRFVLFAERPERILRHGLGAFGARLVLLLDALVDVVAAARWDPDDQTRVRADLRQLHRCAAFLQGRLRAIDPDATAAPAQPGELRLRLFDTELVANHVTAAARELATAGAAVPIALRAQLAGLLSRAQHALRELPTGASDLAAAARRNPAQKPEHDIFPGDVAGQAWQLQSAIRDLLQATVILQRAGDVALADPGTAARELDDARGADRRQPAPTAIGEPAGATLQHGPPQHGPLTQSSRRAIQAAVASGLAVLAGVAVTSTHQYWAALAAFLVLGGTETIEETVVKGLQRVAGTLVGVLVGFGVALLTGADPAVVLPLLVVCLFAAMYLQPVSYALMVFWTTTLLALMYELLGTLTAETLQVRVLETIIGAAIALGTAALLLPIRTRQKVNADAVALLQTVADTVQACLQRLDGSAAAPALAAAALTLDQRFRQLMNRAEPLRRGWGTMRLGGIERRLTTAAALTYYARQLIRATEAEAPATAAPGGLGAARWAALTRDNIGALIELLRHRPPGPLHRSDAFESKPDAEIAAPQAGSAERAALLAVVRINQSVLALVDDLTRDSPADAPERA